MSPDRHGPNRRKRTRGVLIVVVLTITGLLAGTELLLRTKPVVDPSDLVVEGVPPLGLSTAEPVTCRRGVEDTAIDQVEDQLVTGGRTSSTQIFACPAAFDGVRITYAGEAIGELLRRDGGAWLQVNDDPYALEVGPLGRHEELRGFNTGLGVWLPDGLHERISDVGRPGQRGDVLLLRGVVRQADPEDGGGLTLRADELEILAPSIEVDEPFHGLQALIAVVLAVAALSALGWSRRVRRR